MPNRKTPEQRLEDLTRKEAQLKARIQKTKAKVRAVDRKRETRRKIIAGAIALEHATHDPKFNEVMQYLLNKHVSKKDRELFDL